MPLTQSLSRFSAPAWRFLRPIHEMRIVRTIVTAACVNCVLAVSTASAQPPQPFVYAAAGVTTLGNAFCGAVPGANGGTGFTTIGNVSASATESAGQTGGATPSNSGCIGHFGGQASASASFGSLSVYATTSRPNRYAQAQAYFDDVLTYMPTAGQTGVGSTPISFSLNGSYLIAASANDPAHRAAALGFIVREDYFTTNLPDHFVFDSVQAIPTSPTGGSFDGGTVTGTLQFTWGVPFQLYVSLGVSVGDFFDTGVVTGGIVDASHTFVLTNLGLPANASLVAGSGTQYPLNGVSVGPGVPNPSVVPEPATFAMLLGGMLILGVPFARGRSRRIQH